jgi:HEPN domain-containing protein
MNIDPQKASDTRTWLIKASRDLITAEQLFAFEKPMLDSIVYHCHQAAEKAFKGYLFWHDKPFRKTHNLEELLLQSAYIDPTLFSFKADAIFLSPLATQFRYPGDAIEPPLDEANLAFNSANALFAEVLKRLPDEVVPPRPPTS